MPPDEFTLAQQRIAARRSAREASTVARLQASQSASRAHAHISSLPAPLQRLGGIFYRTWDIISTREGTRPSFRVGQVDAELLDEELLSLLSAQVSSGLKYFGTHVADDWNAEILLGLRAVLWKMTVWDHDATYGAALQNLRFTDARRGNREILSSPTSWQKLGYGLVTVGGRYAWSRWEGWLADRDGGYEPPTENVRRLSRLTEVLDTLHSTAAFASFLVFLVNGRYRTILDRILRLRLAPPTSQVSREVSFEYLNRQLIWHAFTEFLLFVLPLVGISRWRRWLARIWKKTKALTRGDEDALEKNVKTGEYAYLPERTCAICYQDQNPTSMSEAEVMAASGASGVIGSAQTDITNPYETIPCGCIYCFVCLAGRIEAEEREGWTCLRCGQDVKECKPWSGDVIEETPRPNTSSKSVGFSEPQQMKVVEPHPENETEKSGSSSEVSELGESEAFDGEDGIGDEIVE